MSARGVSPHLEEHSYPHAGQSKDGVIPIESGRPVTRVARGRGSTRKTIVIAPPYLNIQEGPGWMSNQSSGIQGYVPMALFAFQDAIGWIISSTVVRVSLKVVPVRLRVSPTPSR
jgi:hypothetical protein